MPKLAITDAGGFRELPLKSEVKAGRLASNDIPLDVPEASRQHCRFFQDGSSWFVEDLGSSNGTLVNGRKVSKFELQDGDVISVGSVSIRFLDAGVEEAAPSVDDAWGDDEISLEEEVFLILGNADRRGEIVKVTGDLLTIGRKPRNGLVLSDASVSGDHAELRKKNGTWTVKDLGSSNGTFVNGDPVIDAELASGCVISFGSIRATFGVGSSKDFGPPPEIEQLPDDDPVDSPAATRVSDAFDGSEAPSFKVKTPAKTSDIVFNVVMFAVIAGLVGGVAWLWNQKESRRDQASGPGRHIQANLVPERWWSFEPLPDDVEPTDGEGWRPVDAADSTIVGSVDGAPGSGSGLSLSRGSPSRIAGVIRLEGGTETAFDVVSGRAFRVGARVRSDNSADAAIAIDWMASDETVALRDLIPVPASAEFIEVAGTLVEPGGLTKARIALVIGGTGEAVFDDITLEVVDAPAGRSAKAGSLLASLTPAGSMRLTRPGKTVLRDLGVWSFADAKAPVGPWRGFSPTGSGPGVAGALASGGALTVGLTAEPNVMLDVAINGGSPASDFAAALAGNPADSIVTTLDGETGVRHRGVFAPVKAQAVVVGDAGARVRLRFLAVDGSPARLDVSLSDAFGVSVLRLGRGAASAVKFVVDTSFEAELSSAQQLLAKARESERSGKLGEAMIAFEQVLARFPFEDRIESEARTSVDRMNEAARTALKEFEARADDARFFRTVARDAALMVSIRDAAAKYTGSSVGESLLKLANALEVDRTSTSTQRTAAEAQGALLRAIDYADDPRGRKDVALALLESILRRHAGSDAARDAAARLEKIKASMPAGGEGNK